MNQTKILDDLLVSQFVFASRGHLTESVKVRVGCTKAR